MGGNSLTLGRPLPLGDGSACAIGEIKIHQYPTLLRRRVFKEIQYEDKVMAKLFDIDDVVVATVMKRIPHKGYFFVQNGEPQQIFCHINNGGGLDVTDRGEILFSCQELYLPYEGKEIALVRASEETENPLRNKAAMWVPLDHWKRCSSYVERLNSTYRVIAYNHTINDAPAENNNEEATWAEGILKDLIKEVRSGRIDINGQTYSTEIGGQIFASHVGWQRQVNGKWVDCPCPLPRHLQR
jgi:hypothetical protein